MTPVLNPEQQDAVDHFEGPLLVLAGAGSGKTRVLTTRITNLIEEHGVAPERILALTFTNKAAGQMRDRVRALLGREPQGMWTGTFHAIGARILRRFASRLGWSPGFGIYDAADQESLAKRIVKNDLQLDPKRWNPRAILGAISAAKNELVSVEAYQQTGLDPFQQKVGQVYERYQQALRNANAFDFDDLLVKPVELLRRDAAVLSHYRERFQFILVDEYQDTNHAQYVFIKLLAHEHSNLFVVGDDDQSIYGWRGADVRNILDFEKDFPEARIVRLEQNYRSTGRILEAANRVIAENLRRKGKTLRTDNPAGERLVLVEAADEADEADWIAAEIQARMHDEPSLGLRDFVVLYRTNAQSRAMEEALRRERMPYRVVGGTRFYERREVKDALAYLRLVANPAADEAFLRIVNVPRRGIGDASVARLAEWATEHRVSLLAAAANTASILEIRGGAAKALPALAELVQKLAALANRDLAPDELLRTLVKESGLVEALKTEPDGEERIENLEELIAGAAELQARLQDEDEELLRELAESGEMGPRPLDLFLSHVALVADVDRHDPTADAVPLMTLHNAKGLEFPVVFVAGMEDGLFPLARTFDEPEQLEEERRLFYVGLTRAERKLYLSSARRRRRGGEYMDAVPSSFLESLPPELVEVRRTARARERERGMRPWKLAGVPVPSRRRERLGIEPAEGSDYRVDYLDSQDAPAFTKGSRVRHPQFGAGTVAELSGIGADVRATIDFDTVGRKKVVIRYANLEREWE